MPSTKKPDAPVAQQSTVLSIVQKLAGYFQKNIWAEDIKDYADYIVYNSKLDSQGNEIPGWQTNGSIPIARMHNDVMFSSVYDNVLQSRVSGRTKEDHVKAETVRNYVEWGMSRGWSRKELIESAKEAIICGEGYGFMGFKNEKETIRYKTPSGKPTSKTSIEQYPYLEYVSLFDIMFDPTAPSFYKSRYVVRKRVEHIDDIKAKYGQFIKNIDEAKAKSKGGTPVFTRDYNRVKFAMMNQREGGSVTPSTVASDANGGLDPMQTMDLDFLAANVKNQLTVNYEEGGYYEVIEYWEKKKFIILLNSVEVYNGPNPFPVDRIPFVQMLSNKIPGAPFSVSNSQAIRHVSKVINQLMNLTVDNIKLNVCPIFEMASGTDIDLKGLDYMEYEPFRIYKTATPGSLKKLDLGTGDFSGVNLTQFFIQIAEMISGTSGYAIGYQNKVERSATGVSALTSASKTRLNEFMDSMNVALGLISEFWIQVGIVVLPGEISIKIDDPEGEVEFFKISVEDIIGKFDFEFDAKALKTATRELQRAQAMKLLELAAQIAVNPVTGQAYVNIPELFKVVVDSFEFDGRKIVLSTEEAAKQQSDSAVVNEKYKFKTQDKLTKVQSKYQKKGGYNPSGYKDPNAPQDPAAEAAMAAAEGEGDMGAPPTDLPIGQNASVTPSGPMPTEQGDILADVLS